MEWFIGWIIKPILENIGKLIGIDIYVKFKEWAKDFILPSVIHVYNYTDNVDDNKDGPNPYRGLSHFGPKDKDIFFGRDNIVEKLFNEIVVNKKNFISFVGPSGSGKSSVILAGLVPKLHKRGGWQFTYFRPYYLQDSDPFRDLASALLPFYDLDHSAGKLNLEESAAAHNELTKKLIGYKDNFHEVMKKIEKNYPKNRILVIVDQFEKLYILKNKELRHKFLDCLLSLSVIIRAAHTH